LHDFVDFVFGCFGGDEGDQSVWYTAFMRTLTSIVAKLVLDHHPLLVVCERGDIHSDKAGIDRISQSDFLLQAL